MAVPQLPLPIAPRTALTHIILPAWELLPAAMSTVRAQVFVLANCLQEAGRDSKIAYRWQVYDTQHPERMGAARGIAQFERGSRESRGGVWGVYLHPASRYWLHEACKALGVDFTPAAIYAALHHNDALTVVLARLLAFTDPKALPAEDDWEAAFACYLRTWRPGAWANGTARQRAELRAKYQRNHAAALAAVRGNR